MKDFSYLTNSHPAYIESLYNDFVKDPASVDPEYKKFFEGFDFALNDNNGHAASAAPEKVDDTAWEKELAVYNLILAYRKKGHLIAKTNPLRERKDRGARLELKHFGLDESHLTQRFASGKFIGSGTTTLQEILDQLENVYAHHIGVEYQYILKENRIEWLQKLSMKVFNFIILP